jgi:DNA-binding transcriptional regulator YhcF (GntR family)
MMSKLTIGKQEFDVEEKELPQISLNFYQDNPRVYDALNSGTGEKPTQKQIEDYMTGLDNVKQLKLSIQSNGGLIDPLIVRDGDNVVLEGNSRLAAYRLLGKLEPEKWAMVKCIILPKDIDDASIFTLLGQYHIVGRKDWEPFEQASYLYRRHLQTKLPVEAMARELGITKSKAQNMIDVITFMYEQNDMTKSHWSYYEEYLKNAAINKYRAEHPEIDNTFVEQVKAETFTPNAPAVRHLGEIAKINNKDSRKLMSEIVNKECTVEEAYSELKDQGVIDDAAKQLRKFKENINTDNFEKQVLNCKKDGVIEYDIKKIIDRLSKVLKKMNDGQ